LDITQIFYGKFLLGNLIPAENSPVTFSQYAKFCIQRERKTNKKNYVDEFREILLIKLDFPREPPSPAKTPQRKFFIYFPITNIQIMDKFQNLEPFP